MGIAERMGAIIGIRPDNEKRVTDIERLIGAYEANTDILVRESTRRQLVWINDASPNNISYAQLSQYRAFNLAKNALQDACGRVRQELETIEGDIYSDEANDLLKEFEQTINNDFSVA